MLLALWFDFPPASWVTGPTPTPPVNNILPDGGSSGRPMDYWQTQWPRTHEDYFDAREEHLRRINQPPESKPVQEIEVFKNLEQPIIFNIRPTKMVVGHLDVVSAQQKVLRLQQRWMQLQQQQEDEDIEILLLS